MFRLWKNIRLENKKKMAQLTKNKDKDSNDVYQCKICKRFFKEKDFFIDIRSCRHCIEPFMESDQ